MNLNLRIKYYMLYQFFSGFLFFMPVLLSIYLKRNISVENIFLIEGSYYLSIFLLEIPTGWFADKYGHDRSVFIGLVGSFFTYIIFSITYTLIGIIICQFILGFFSSLISGSDKASFYKYIIKENSDKGFLLQKKANILFITANLIGFILGGILYKFDNEGIWILLLTGVANLIAGIFYFLYCKELKFINDNSKGDISIPNSIIKNVRLVIFPCLVGGIILGLLSNFYWVSQMYYNNLKIPEEWRGVLFSIGSLITISFSKIRIFKNNTLSKTLILLFPTCYFLTIINNILVVPLFIIIYSLLKIETQPYIENYILSISKDSKALSLSVTSWIYNFVDVILMLMFFVLFKHFTYPTVMTIQAIFILAIFITMLSLYKINHKKQSINMYI